MQTLSTLLSHLVPSANLGEIQEAWGFHELPQVTQQAGAQVNEAAGFKPNSPVNSPERTRTLRLIMT